MLDARVDGNHISNTSVLRLVGIVSWIERISRNGNGGQVSPRLNPKALHIAVIDIPLDSPPLVRFKEKGHMVYGYNSEVERALGYDVVIGPRCWRIDPLLKLGDDVMVEESLERQLEMMEKGIRNIKYPKEKKDV